LEFRRVLFRSRVRCRSTRSARRSPISLMVRAARSRPAPTVSRSTARTVISCSNSCRRTQTCAPTSTAGRSRTARASRSKPRPRSPMRSARTGPAFAEAVGAARSGIRLSPGSTCNAIDEGAEDEALYRYLVAELAKLDLAYVHVVHHGNEPLVQDIRRLWPNALLLNRPGQPLEKL